jgi:hypothetical protein
MTCCHKGMSYYFCSVEAPRAPYLVVEGRRLGAGARLEARENTALAVRCVVDGGRPAPSALDWLLVGPGGTEEGLGNASSPLQAEFSPTERQYHAASELRLERVSRVLHNATLVCVASHVALPQPVNATLRLDVQCAYIASLHIFAPAITTPEGNIFLR